ncbi:MAG: DUF805 domain-containing protein [Alphaproteobacteria bacterium]|nr:DUF805 domain-containing protein [Alphaproteobacteria bacterium]
MLIKDKDLLADEPVKKQPDEVKVPVIKKENMHSAWGDAVDYYLRDITEKYMLFRGRASRLEFWGYMAVFSIVLIPLYLLGNYADIRMLAYYFIMATAIPSVAVAARRLHDTNKRSSVYLAILGILPLLTIFIGYWALIPFLLWVALLIRLWSLKSIPEEGIYGPAPTDDDAYGEDSNRIVKKFRILALFLIAIWIALTYVNFDNWSRQAEYTSTNDAIMEQIEKSGKKAGLSNQQIQAEQNIMKQTLKSWNGKTVQQDDIAKAIEQTLKTISSLNNK